MKKLISLLAILILVFAMFVACNPDQINTKSADDGEIGFPPRLDVYNQDGILLTIEVPLEFDEVVVGESKKLEVKIHNSGGYTIWSPRIFVHDGSTNFVPEPIAVDSFPVGASMPNTIVYSPITGGKEKAIIRIEGGYSISPSGPIFRYAKDFLVTGAGIYPIINVYFEDELVTLENPVNFGDVYVGNSKKLELVVKNEGKISLKSPKVDMLSSGLNEWKITDFGGMKSLEPGDKVSLYMTYTPANIGQDKIVPIISGFFFYGGNTYNYKTEFAATGNGLTPILVIRDYKGNILTPTNPLDFGTVVVKQTEKLEVFITNEGNATLYSPQMNQLSSVKTVFKFDQLGIRSLPPSRTVSTTIYFTPLTETDYKTSFEVSGWYDFANSFTYSTSFGAYGKGVYVIYE